MPSFSHHFTTPLIYTSPQLLIITLPHYHITTSNLYCFLRTKAVRAGIYNFSHSLPVGSLGAGSVV